jgi:hypothetical protein
MWNVMLVVSVPMPSSGISSPMPSKQLTNFGQAL